MRVQLCHEEENFITFDYCQQYTPEIEFGINSTRFLRPRQISYLPFSKIDLNGANMKNLSLSG